MKRTTPTKLEEGKSLQSHLLAITLLQNTFVARTFPEKQISCKMLNCAFSLFRMETDIDDSVDT